MFLRISRHFVPVPVLLLATFEISIICFGWYFLLQRHSQFAAPWSGLETSSWLSVILLLAGAMVLSGWYHNKAFIDYKVMAFQTVITIAFLCPVIFFGLVFWQEAFGLRGSVWEVEREVLLCWLLGILVTRLGFLALVDLNIFKRPILVLGAGRKAARIAEVAAERSNRLFVPTAFIHSGKDQPIVEAVDCDLSGDDPEVIARLAHKLRIREVVVATDDRRGLPVKALLQCKISGIPVIDYLDFMEREIKIVDLNVLQPSWLIFSDGFRTSLRAKLIKRCCDVLLSLTILLLTLPLMLVVAVLIAVEDRGPVLFRQERVGLGGRTFVLLKFRSMSVDAEKDGAARWASARDHRVTRVGRIIRKLRVDELPQLVNVLRGNMSFVGPRPERPSFVEHLAAQIPFYAERHCVKPGITGWAQINYPYGASLEDARNKLTYDLYYVKNHGLFLDLVIVSQTLRVILWADGAR